MGPWIYPLINGKPSEFFKSSRGLRQGRPLSPFLYIIMEDSLSQYLEKKRRERSLIGLHISQGVKSINHFLFIDDTLLMEGESCILTIRFKKVLEKFMEASSGLLNNTKCRICGWNVPPRTLQRIS